MKRLLSVALVLSLLGASAAVAAPYGYDNRGYAQGSHNNNGALFAGLGIVALAAILASQNNNHYRQDRYNRYDNRDYRGGYDTRRYGGYDSRGYGGYGADRRFDDRSRHW